MDLLSSIMLPGAESALKTWQGEAGSPIQSCVWEITRCAGILSAREYQKNQSQGHTNIVGSSKDLISASQPSTESLVKSILCSIRVLRSGGLKEVIPFKQTLLYPVVAAASQSQFLTELDQNFILDCVKDIARNNGSGSNPYYNGIHVVLTKLWAGDVGTSLENVARNLGHELGLF